MAPLLAPKKSFYLSNLQVHRGGNISLGNIFADPFSIHDNLDALSTPTPASLEGNPLPQTDTTPSKECVHEARQKSWTAAIWARLLSILQVNIGSDHSRGEWVAYQIPSMETVTFKTGEREYVKKRLAAEPDLEQYIKEKPLYMINGIKYAAGLKMFVEQVSHMGVGTKMAATVDPDGSISLGGAFGGSCDHHGLLSKSIPDEIVFAYQLLRISEKGWRQKKLDLRIRHEEALLGNQPSSETDDFDFELDVFTMGHIDEAMEDNRLDDDDYARIEPLDNGEDEYAHVIATY